MDLIYVCVMGGAVALLGLCVFFNLISLSIDESAHTVLVDTTEIGLVFERNGETYIIPYDSIISIEKSDETSYSYFKQKYSVELTPVEFDYVMNQVCC